MLVSVVIPARNDAPMLRRALAALAAQERPADEIVVVDNDSTDDTAAVAAAGGARVIREEVHGIPQAASTGYDAAAGRLIARIDADTVVPSDWVAHIVADFENDPQLDVVSGSAEFYGAGRVTRRLGKAWWIGGMYWSMTAYLGHPPVFGSNFVMRREVWAQLRTEVHRTTRTIHDDLDLSLHIKPWMTVRYDPELKVEISARPFATVRGLARRVGWVVPTLSNHWPEDSPWNRREARRRWQSERSLRPEPVAEWQPPAEEDGDEREAIA